MKKILSFIMSFFLLLSVGYSNITYASENVGDMAVHFLDVGQGLSILVQSGGQNLIYDGGGRESSSFVVSYLKNQNIENIDYLISSHYDEDHVSGLIGCLNAFNVNCVIGPDYVHDTELYTSFMNSVSSEGLDVQHPVVGDVYIFGTGQFTIIAPNGINPNDSNGNSIAIKLVNGSNSFILTGDAEEQSEQDMISSGLNLDCDVLSIGHHGSASSTTWDLLESSTPNYAVVSCGSNNSYGHPAAETMEKLSSMNIPVFRTDKQGTIIALSNGSEISWNTEPCNDYTSGELISELETLVTAQEESIESAGITYILNINSKKIHYPDCGSVKQMKDKNKKEFTGNRDELISSGYEPCGNCNP